MEKAQKTILAEFYKSVQVEVEYLKTDFLKLTVFCRPWKVSRCP